MKLVGRNYLLCKQVGHDFNAELAAVNVVAKKQEIGRGQWNAEAPQSFFKAHQITKVTMDITYKNK